MTTDPIIQEYSMSVAAQKVIDFIYKVKNTEISGETLYELEKRFQTLAGAYNSNPLIAFPVKIIAEPIDKIAFEIRNTCFSKLKFSEVYSVIDRLIEVENLDDGQCLDVLCVLIDYSNIVIYSRFDHGLALEQKK